MTGCRCFWYSGDSCSRHEKFGSQREQIPIPVTSRFPGALVFPSQTLPTLGLLNAPRLSALKNKHHVTPPGACLYIR